ncbi:DUF1828 domain-containing protein [Halomonas sp.]|uniref:DUF1828 domain-containing protein n=1 Tax=Halomonas sp. TaxID=1486246 RepID=UPI003A92D1C4
MRERLCEAFCADVRVIERRGKILISLPLSGRDGDRYTVYVVRSSGGWRLSDGASTLMRLSYENDIARLLDGARGKLFELILNECQIQHDDGELFLNVSVDAGGLIQGLFTLAQGMSRIEDLSLWTRNRAETTFYDDLRRQIIEIGGNQVHENYSVPNLPNAANYPIDYFIESNHRPIYLFGVGNKEKAQLATIVLQYLTAQQHRHHSIIVCSDMDTLPKQVRFRLMDAANDMIPTLDGHEGVLRHKIKDRLTG